MPLHYSTINTDLNMQTPCTTNQAFDERKVSTGVNAILLSTHGCSDVQASRFRVTSTEHSAFFHTKGRYSSDFHMATNMHADWVTQEPLRDRRAVADHPNVAPLRAVAPDSTHSCTFSHGSNKTFDPIHQKSQDPGVASASAQGDKHCRSDGAASIAESATRPPSAIPSALILSYVYTWYCNSPASSVSHCPLSEVG